MVIQQIERQLPLRPFAAEWELVGRGADSALYRPFTKLEPFVPLVFMLLYEVLYLMARTKVFVSYDYDHDAQLKDTLIGQSRLADSPFSINDASLLQATPEWQQKARAAVGSCDVFIVLLGEHTHQAQGVRREARTARDLGKRRFQLRKRGQFPTRLDGAGEVVAWKWKNLKRRLSSPTTTAAG